MNLLSWTMVALAVVAAALSVETGNDLSLAVPTGAAAVTLVALAGAIELRSRSARLEPVDQGVLRPYGPEVVESDSMLRLRRGFETGPIGRASVLATLRALERELGPRAASQLSLETERAVLGLPPDQFRSWVDERVRRIEAAT